MAIKLLHQFGSLDEVLRRPDEAQPKRAATALATEDALAAARLSKQLVELRTDVERAKHQPDAGQHETPGSRPTAAGRPSTCWQSWNSTATRGVSREYGAWYEFSARFTRLNV